MCLRPYAHFYFYFMSRCRWASVVGFIPHFAFVHLCAWCTGSACAEVALNRALS